MTNKTRRLACLLGAASIAALALPAHADPAPATAQVTAPSLEAQFQDPPQSARPRVWWHWMNGNITKDGIAKDMAWMKRVGIGGMQNFDASLMTPQIVDKRLVYMTPEWKDAFKFAASEADRLGLELAIAASPGWSETGGPWVTPEDGLKKLVWSETLVAGGKPFKGTLAMPPQVTGPFQSIVPAGSGIDEMLGGVKPKAPPQHFGEVKVLAFPASSEGALVPVAAKDGTGVALDAAKLSDADLAGGVGLSHGGVGGHPILMLDYGKPVTARSMTLFAPGAAAMFVGALYSPRLEASDNGSDWRSVADVETAEVTTTASFPAVTARYFRVEFLPKKGAGIQMGSSAPGIAMDFNLGAMMAGSANKPMTVGDFRLSGEARVDRFEPKAGFEIVQNYYDLTGPADGATGVNPASVIDLSDKLRPDGTLDWTPPKGQWRVLRFGYSLLGTTNHPAPPEATGLEVDKFDGDAVRGYLEHYIGMYKDASGGLIGDHGVRAILTDSIEVGAANWTPKMIAQFKRLRGYDPTPWMPALSGVLVGSRTGADRGRRCAA